MRATGQAARRRSTTPHQRRRLLYELIGLPQPLPESVARSRGLRLRDFTSEAQEVLRLSEAASTTILDWPELLKALRHSPEVARSAPLVEQVDLALAAHALSVPVGDNKEDVR